MYVQYSFFKLQLYCEHNFLGRMLNGSVNYLLCLESGKRAVLPAMLSIVCRCVISRHMMSKCLANLSWFPVLHDLPCKSISGVPHLPFAHLSLFCPQDQQCIPSVYLKKAKRNALRMLIKCSCLQGDFQHSNYTEIPYSNNFFTKLSVISVYEELPFLFLKYFWMSVYN